VGHAAGGRGTAHVQELSRDVPAPRSANTRLHCAAGDYTRHRHGLLSAKRARGLGKNSVRLVRAVLSAMLTDALNEELIEAHPALKIGKGRGRKAPDTMRQDEREDKGPHA